MRMTKKITSIVLAVLMVVSMMVVGTVAASAATTVTSAAEFNAIADADGEYVLGADIDLGNGYLIIPEGRTVTIDFADYTYTSKWGIENHGTLTVKAGTGGATGTKNVFDNFGTLTVKSGTYAAPSGYGVYAEANSTTTIENGTFTAQECCVCTIAETHDATITIKNGTFTSADNSVLSGNGSTGAGNNTWTISGGTYNANIQSAGYVAAGIYAPNNDTWTISGGTFNVTNGVGICQRAGVVNVKGGTFNVTGDGTTGKVGDSRVVVPAGDALVYDEVSSYPGYTAESTMAVTGGTFNAQGDAVYAVAGAASDTHIDIQGGTFTGDVEDYVDMDDITYTFTNAAGKVQYKTSAFTSSTLSSNGTYKLYKDVNLGLRCAPTVFAKNITIDLNGHTFTSTATDEAFLFSRTPASYTIKNGTINASTDGIFVSASNVDLTLDNVTLNATGTFGVVTNGTQTNNNITIKDSEITSGKIGIYKPSNGALTLKDSDVTGEVAVYVKSGDVTINGGTFTGTGAAADYSYNGNGANPTGDAIVIDNCGYPGGAPTVTITSGKFVSENANAVGSYAGAKAGATAPEALDNFISGGEFSSDVSDLVVTGSTANTGGTDSEAPFVIVPDTFVAQVGDTKYDTVSEAISAAQAGDTVKLLKDVTGPVSVPAGKDITLDLNGNTISGGYYGIENNGTVTVEGPGTVSGTYGVRANANSSTTINGGTFNAQECAVATFKNTKNATITINDGTFTTVDNSVLSGNGSTASDGNTWNINGGTFNGNITSAGYVAAGIYAPNDDTWNVNGGTFNITKGAGIVQRAGVVNVADGVVINTTGNVTGRVGDSRVVVPCSAIVFDSEANYPALQSNPDSVMNVTGGTFTSEDDNGAVTTVPLNTDTHVDVYGGSFSSVVPDNCCADGFSPVTTADAQGKYTVEPFTNPLVPDMINAADAKAQDGNKFGLTCDYLKGTLLGVQKKNKISDADITSESGQENGNDIRFIAVLDTNILKSADDYGFVLAKVTDSDTKTFNTENTLFDKLKKGDDRAKTISAKGTYNNVCGTGDYSAYGDPTADTDYKYITCAVNSLSDTDKVAARFYVTIGEKTYYAQYAGYNYQYTGCTAGISLLG